MLPQEGEQMLLQNRNDCTVPPSADGQVLTHELHGQRWAVFPYALRGPGFC